MKFPELEFLDDMFLSKEPDKLLHSVLRLYYKTTSVIVSLTLDVDVLRIDDSSSFLVGCMPMVVNT